MAKVLMKGNEAIAESAIRHGCLHYFGYPITPQTEIAEYMAKRMPKVGGLCLQAESEVAAINMVLGAASAGARTMTSSSSPGISLKCEGISYLIGSDRPSHIVNIQRGSPGLGSIQPSQQDYYQATKALGHGDSQVPVLAPSSVQELADFAGVAFDIGDKYRTPVMLLADGALGQMMEPVELAPEGQTVLPDKPWATNGHENKRKRNIINSLYIQPDVLEKVVLERYKRYGQIEENEIRFENYMTEDADIILVSYGITSRICKTAVGMAREKGIKAGLFRPITLWPYPKKQLMAHADQAKKFLVVELNMGQMVDDVKVSIESKKPVHFFGRTGGMMPSPADVLRAIESEGGVR